MALRVSTATATTTREITLKTQRAKVEPRRSCRGGPPADRIAPPTARDPRPQLLLIGECASKIKSSLDTKAPVALDTISEEADPRGGEH